MSVCSDAMSGVSTPCRSGYRAMAGPGSPQFNMRQSLRRALSPQGSPGKLETAKPDLFSGGAWSPRRNSPSPSPLSSPRGSAADLHQAGKAFGKVSAPRPGMKELLSDSPCLPTRREASPHGLTLTEDGIWSSKRPEVRRNRSTGVSSLLAHSPRKGEAEAVLPSGRKSPRQESVRTVLAAKTMSSEGVKDAFSDASPHQLRSERREKSPFASGVKGRREGSANCSRGVASLIGADLAAGAPGMDLPEHRHVSPTQQRRLLEQRGSGVRGAGVGGSGNEEQSLSSVARSCQQICNLRAKTEIFQLRDMDMTRSGTLPSGGGMGPFGSMSQLQYAGAASGGTPVSRSSLRSQQRPWEDYYRDF